MDIEIYPQSAVGKFTATISSMGNMDWESWSVTRTRHIKITSEGFRFQATDAFDELSWLGYRFLNFYYILKHTYKSYNDPETINYETYDGNLYNKTYEAISQDGISYTSGPRNSTRLSEHFNYETHERDGYSLETYTLVRVAANYYHSWKGTGLIICDEHGRVACRELGDSHPVLRDNGGSYWPPDPF